MEWSFWTICYETVFDVWSPEAAASFCFHVHPALLHSATDNTLVCGWGFEPVKDITMHIVWIFLHEKCWSELSEMKCFLVAGDSWTWTNVHCCNNLPSSKGQCEALNSLERGDYHHNSISNEETFLKYFLIILNSKLLENHEEMFPR